MLLCSNLMEKDGIVVWEFSRNGVKLCEEMEHIPSIDITCGM